MTKIHWAFLNREVEVTLLSDKVAYSWTCNVAEPEGHIHTIACLWIWHDCDHSLDPAKKASPDYPEGWTPAGVGLHDLISIEPLHIEASVYWPNCCGMHGWVRDGKYISV